MTPGDRKIQSANTHCGAPNFILASRLCCLLLVTAVSYGGTPHLNTCSPCGPRSLPPSTTCRAGSAGTACCRPFCKAKTGGRRRRECAREGGCERREPCKHSFRWRNHSDEQQYASAETRRCGASEFVPLLTEARDSQQQHVYPNHLTPAQHTAEPARQRGWLPSTAPLA